MLIGKRLNGRYKIIKMIGGGGMANVYLARDIILERDVAVKILRFDFSSDEQFIKRFRREAHAATSLNHENIVSIYDIGEDEGIYYIVMEYVHGCTLKQYIQQYAPLSIEQAVNIMLQLTSAISHAHEYRIIHRDIKPQNILIDETGNIKVTDFGIAIALSSTTITQTNSVLGSIHYLSPEQARGGIATEKSDIYSLGIVMFELLTGRLPFSGESAVSIVLKHLQNEVPSPKVWNPKIPQSLENIIIRATAKNPFHRYESVGDMWKELQTALDPERRNEAKLVLPQEDDEVTKAIPIIKDDTVVASEKTIVRNGVHEKEETKEKPKKKRKWAIWLTVLLLLIVSAGVSIFTWVPSIFFPDDVTMPDVTNVEYDKAVEQLLSHGMVIGETIEIEDDHIAAGRVVRTTPEAGKVVKEGTEVIIYKSIGKKKVKMDDLIGKTIDEAESQLYNQKFLLVVKNEVHREEPAGTIVDQYPSPGESVVPEETEVTLTVSLGPEKIVLKDLTGYTEKSVRDYAEEQGLTVIVKREYSDKVPEGLVISQVPQASAEVEKGTKLTIVISRGREPIPEKKVVHEIEIPYEPENEGEIVEAHLYIQDARHDMTKPYKKYRLTETVTEKVEFIIPHGGKAHYRVVVNNIVKHEGVVNYPTR